MNILLLAFGFALLSQTPPPKNPPAKKRTESFWRTVLRFTGISANPGGLRDIVIAAEPGDLFLINIDGSNRRRLAEGRYVSPVFRPGDKELLALREDSLVAVKLDGSVRKVCPGSQIVKLVSARAQEVLSIGKDGEVTILDVRSCRITPLPHENDGSDRELADHLVQWSRSYGPINLIVATERSIGPFPKSWTDVFLEQNGARTNLSVCRGVNCGQPSLSQDKRLVAFIQASPPGS